MEEKNESEFEFDFGYYRHTAKENHKSEIKSHKEFINNHKLDKNPNDEVKERMKEFKKDNKYHKMRKKCIKKYIDKKKVPKIQAPDKYFSEYSYYREKHSEEELYPNDKKISLYEKGNFVVHQVYNTCYFMASILGLIDKGNGDYIKEKMVREYTKDKTKAIVRLHDEDGLPVDIIVDKTRSDDDNRPLWLIMLEKAVCVMMNTNEFGIKNRNKTNYVPGMNVLFNKQAKIVERVNWYKIEEKQKNGEEVFKLRCFSKKDIGDSGETVGFKLLFGKKVVDKRAFFRRFPNLQSKSLSFNANENNDNMTFLKYFLSRNKLVIGSANGSDFTGFQKDHVMYFKSYDENYVYGFESIGGPFQITIADFNKMSNLYAAEFPGDKEKAKKIEDYQEDKKNNRNEMENNDLVDVNNKIGNSEGQETENIIDNTENIQNNTENDNWDLINNKINIVDEDRKDKKIDIDARNIKKTDNAMNSGAGDNINIIANNKLSIVNDEDNHFINWKFITLGILFFIGTVLAFYFDIYLFISIGFLVIGLCLIFLGLKNIFKTCVAYKFFDFAPPKQNKSGNVVDKNRDRIDNNNLKLTKNTDSKTSYI